jgi:hypothetical protein
MLLTLGSQAPVLAATFSDLVVNIDATVNGHPDHGHVPVSVAAITGVYRATLVNPSLDATAAHTAWCYACSVPSWRTHYGIRFADASTITRGSATLMESTAQAAFDATPADRLVIHFLTPTQQNLEMFVPDNVVADNGGGVSFLLERFVVLDVDGDGDQDPLTDGLLVLRRLFGFTGAVLVEGAVDSANCSRCTAVDIEAYLALIASALDVDGSGVNGALTDGLLVLRWLFGFTGATLTAGAVDAVACTRCETAAIEERLQELRD